MKTEINAKLQFIKELDTKLLTPREAGKVANQYHFEDDFSKYLENMEHNNDFDINKNLFITKLKEMV
jgi:hypothetical protein